MPTTHASDQITFKFSIATKEPSDALRPIQDSIPFSEQRCRDDARRDRIDALPAKHTQGKRRREKQRNRKQEIRHRMHNKAPAESGWRNGFRGAFHEMRAFLYGLPSRWSADSSGYLQKIQVARRLQQFCGERSSQADTNYRYQSRQVVPR